MADIQVVLANGTTADANDVMANFTEIFTDIDETNIGAANKTGTGKIALQASPTITSPTISGTVSGGASYTSPTITGTVVGGASYTAPTITSPTISGTVAGGASYTSPTITGTVSGSATYTTPTLSSPTISGVIPANVTIGANATTGYKLAFGSGVSQYTEHGGIYSEGCGYIASNASQALNSDSWSQIDATKKSSLLQVDYAGNFLGFYTAVAGKATGTYSAFWGSPKFSVNADGELLLPSTNPPTANYANQNGIVKAWAQISVTMAAGALGAPSPTLVSSYNVSSVTGSGTPPRVNINWNTDFSSSNYAVFMSCDNVQSGQVWHEYSSSPKTASSITIIPSAFTTSATYSVYIMAIGTQ